MLGEMKIHLPRLAVVIGLSLSVACAHRVQVTSTPPGAQVRYRGRAVGTTPCEFTTVWLPFRKMDLHVRLPGYRASSVGLGSDTSLIRLLSEVLTPWRWPRALGRQVRARHNVVLVRRHGRAGTWTPAEALEAP